MRTPLILILAFISGNAFGQSNLPSCNGDKQEKRNGCISSQNATNDLQQGDENKEETKFELEVDDYQKRSNIKFDQNLNFPDALKEFKYKYNSPKK